MTTQLVLATLVLYVIVIVLDNEKTAKKLYAIPWLYNSIYKLPFGVIVFSTMSWYASEGILYLYNM